MRVLTAITILAALFSAYAFAGEHAINIVGRTGWSYQDNNSSTVANSSSFNFDYLRATFEGAVSQTVKYYVVTDFLGTTGNDIVDGTPSLIDAAILK